MLDEEALEAGLAAAAHSAGPNAYARRVGPILRHTPEGAAAERGLQEGVGAVQAKARAALADKIRVVLAEPLSDVCRRIIDVGGGPFWVCVRVRGIRADRGQSSTKSTSHAHHDATRRNRPNASPGRTRPWQALKGTWRSSAATLCASTRWGGS